MKRSFFLPAVLALAAMVTVFSCTPLQEVDGGYYERTSSAAGRIYVDDPYRGTVILERDPYTGRYYEVNSYGRYGYGYDPYYNGRNYPRRNTRVYRAPRQVTPQPPTKEQIRQREENRKEARSKVLGN